MLRTHGPSRIGSLSNEETGSLITSGFGSCVSILSLANVLSAQGSIVQPRSSLFLFFATLPGHCNASGADDRLTVNTWLGSACANTCDQTTLTNATNIVEQGCSSDLQNGNAVAVSRSTPVALQQPSDKFRVQSALDVLTKNYTQVKDALCLQAKSNSTFCVTNLLTDIQNASGNNISVSARESDTYWSRSRSLTHGHYSRGLVDQSFVNLELDPERQRIDCLHRLHACSGQQGRSPRECDEFERDVHVVVRRFVVLRLVFPRRSSPINCSRSVLVLIYQWRRKRDLDWPQEQRQQQPRSAIGFDASIWCCCCHRRVCHLK